MNSDESTSEVTVSDRRVGETPVLSEGDFSPDDRSRRSRRRYVLFGVFCLILLAGSMPAYRWWHAYRSQQYKAACDAAVENQSWELLEKIANRWVQWDPSGDDGWVFLAEASTQLSKPGQAADSLGRVSESYHGALQAMALRGDILFTDLNRPYEAVETWKRMLKINPLADLARQRLIYFYAMTLQRDLMLEHILKAMELKCEPPEAYAYYLQAYEVKFSDGLSILTKWHKNDTENKELEIAHAIYAAKYTPSNPKAQFGARTLEPGDTTLISNCLEKYPSHIEVLAFFIEKAIDEGDEKRVLELLNQSPAKAERDGRFWRYRGWYLATQGRHEEAVEAFRKSLELHPVDWHSRWLQAGSLRRLNRAEEASRSTEIGLLGKDLNKELFQRPNARAVDHKLLVKIHDYLKKTGAETARRALERRIF